MRLRGGRVDLGILERTERIWTSDCNDALERQIIQAGTSILVPPELMGAHIGPTARPTTGRSQTLAFRAATALFGHFGVEWDLLTLTDAELGELTRRDRACTSSTAGCCTVATSCASTSSATTPWRTACTPPIGQRPRRLRPAAHRSGAHAGAAAAAGTGSVTALSRAHRPAPGRREHRVAALRGGSRRDRAQRAPARRPRCAAAGDGPGVRPAAPSRARSREMTVRAGVLVRHRLTHPDGRQFLIYGSRLDGTLDGQPADGRGDRPRCSDASIGSPAPGC